jgi:carbon-monoxide dehydrogenase large subunit
MPAYSRAVTSSILGTSVQRLEDPRFLTGRGTYIDNLELTGALHLAFVRSPMAHAEVSGLDIADAARAPGVAGVYTWADLAAAGIQAIAPVPFANQQMLRPWLADGRVRYVGEPVVAVVAESRAAAVDAAELVLVDLEPLPAVVDLDAALADEVLLFPEAGTNIAAVQGGPAPDDHFAGCEVVVDLEMVHARMAPVPLEGRTVASQWEGGRLTHWACTQMPHMVKESLVGAFGLDPADVRVVVPDVGGGFGAKFRVTGEEFLCAWASRHHGRPVRWQETRSENLTNMPHGRAQRHRIRLGGTRDGQLQAYAVDIVQDGGGYPNIGSFMTVQTRRMASGPYAIERVNAYALTVATTTTPIGAYRGAGRPEATAALERAVDRYAAEIGMDPGELRRRNLLAPDAFPYRTPMNETYDSGNYVGALDGALDHAGYHALRAEQARRRAAGATRVLGIGLASYVEITNPAGGGEWGEIEVDATGQAVVRTGSSGHGQGHDTVWAQIAAAQTAIALDRIRVHHGDTDEIPRGNGTGGSKSLQSGGVAIHVAAAELVERARRLAAEHLEAAVADVVLSEKGTFHVAGTPAVAIGWAELAAAQPEQRLLASIDYQPGGATFPFGTHLSVVEVDLETGKVVVLRHISVDDAGTVVNPLLFDGQVHGGVASGIACALWEAITYDADGNPLTTNLADYAVPSAAELPSFENHVQETPSPHNPLGAKGIGEAGTIGAMPAVHNAVIDALAHLGVRHLDIPLTPEVVWRATEAATRA